ncbi:hypothetical protein [Clostridium hydrogenum]|uniref:hypothetical protein n=1 Tax=Clostridium hydrogenum TaxID=2855764 RepID=UPI001F160F4D|nr:hypothetical protein [Clostridium hydrogenum]
MQVYQKNQYKIYRVGNGFIVHNSNYDFVSKHTHIKSFKQAKNLIYFVTNKKVPRWVSFYYLESLIRISDDKNYIKRVNKLIEVKRRKPKVKFKQWNRQIFK